MLRALSLNNSSVSSKHFEYIPGSEHIGWKIFQWLTQKLLKIFSFIQFWSIMVKGCLCLYVSGFSSANPFMLCFVSNCFKRCRWAPRKKTKVLRDMFDLTVTEQICYLFVSFSKLTTLKLKDSLSGYSVTLKSTDWGYIHLIPSTGYITEWYNWRGTTQGCSGQDFWGRSPDHNHGEQYLPILIPISQQANQPYQSGSSIDNRG